MRRLPAGFALIMAVVLGATTTAMAARAQELPRVPECFHTATLDCQGVQIRAAGVPVVTLTGDKKGIFKISASLTADLKTPQNINEQGERFYNHYNWSAPGRVRGCGTNQASCTVHVRRGGGGWTPVIFSLDDYPVTIYLLYAPPKGKVVLSGHVYKHECDAKSKCSDVAVRAADGQAVAVKGAGGSAETETDSDGLYGFLVKKGQHTVRLPGSSKIADPSSRSVTASSDVGHLDFTVCRTPKGYTGKKLPCDLVEIQGRLVDVAGTGLSNIVVTTPEDSAVPGPDGRFLLHVPKGPAALTAGSADNTLPPAKFTVDARGAITRATLKVPVRFLVVDPLGVQPTTESMALLVHWLAPVNPGLKFILSLDGGPTVDCQAKLAIPYSGSALSHPGPPRYEFDNHPTSSSMPFCTGNWTVKLFDAHGKPLAEPVDFTVIEAG